MLIIGGTGDLSRRHLLPALAQLLANGDLDKGFAITLSGLEEMPLEACRALVASQLKLYAPHVAADVRRELAARTSYVRADVRDTDALRDALPKQPVLVYVATPPAAVPFAVAAIRRAGIDPASRIILDKPFGLSRASARSLNEALARLVDARHVFRIDHFLYHHVVQELVRWRVEHDIVPLADLLRVTHAEVVWEETRAVSTGGTPYCGVIRDMVQSHLLQLVALVTMDSPRSLKPEHLAQNRLDALRRISVAGDDEAPPVRARHLSGGDMVAPERADAEPETLAMLALRTNSPRWEGTSIRLRAAKGVQSSRRHIELRFVGRSNRRAVGFVRLEVLEGKLVVGLVGARPWTVEFDIGMSSESPSVRLLRDAFVGDDTFTLLPEEPEECWRIVEPAIVAFDRRRLPMLTYPVGTPVESLDCAGAHARHD